MLATSIKRLETWYKPASNSKRAKKSRKNMSYATKAAACAIKQFEARQEEKAKAKETVTMANGILMPKKSPKSLNSTTIKMGSSTYN